jgi:hypothetical protein
MRRRRWKPPTQLGQSILDSVPPQGAINSELRRLLALFLDSKGVTRCYPDHFGEGSPDGDVSTSGFKETIEQQRIEAVSHSNPSHQV